MRRRRVHSYLDSGSMADATARVGRTSSGITVRASSTRWRTPAGGAACPHVARHTPAEQWIGREVHSLLTLAAEYLLRRHQSDGGVSLVDNPLLPDDLRALLSEYKPCLLCSRPTREVASSLGWADHNQYHLQQHQRSVRCQECTKRLHHCQHEGSSNTCTGAKWLCLTCGKVSCSAEEAFQHSVMEEHHLAWRAHQERQSEGDQEHSGAAKQQSATWCFACSQYVDKQSDHSIADQKRTAFAFSH